MRLNDCKTEARGCLKARKLRVIRMSVCIAALAVLSGFASYCLPMLFPFAAKNGWQLCSAQTALFLLTTGLLGSLRQGRAAWLYCSACGKEPSSVQFRYWLRRGRGFRAAMLYASLAIRKAAWTVLLASPGSAILIGCALFGDRQDGLIRSIAWSGGAVCLMIGLFFAGWICQKYALAPILLARNPAKGVRSAVRGSGFLMDDACLRLYLLKLSFLPWAASCAAVLPLLYVLPYYQQTTTCMLRDILRAHTI